MKITCPKYFVIKSMKRREYLEQVHNLAEYDKNMVYSHSKEYSCKFPVIVKNSYGSGKGIKNKKFIVINQKLIIF